MYVGAGARASVSLCLRLSIHPAVVTRATRPRSTGRGARDVISTLPSVTLEHVHVTCARFQVHNRLLYADTISSLPGYSESTKTHTLIINRSRITPRPPVYPPLVPLDHAVTCARCKGHNRLLYAGTISSLPGYSESTETHTLLHMHYTRRSYNSQAPLFSLIYRFQSTQHRKSRVYGQDHTRHSRVERCAMDLLCRLFLRSGALGGCKGGDEHALF